MGEGDEGGEVAAEVYEMLGGGLGIGMNTAVAEVFEEVIGEEPLHGGFHFPRM